MFSVVRYLSTRQQQQQCQIIKKIIECSNSIYPTSNIKVITSIATNDNRYISTANHGSNNISRYDGNKVTSSSIEQCVNRIKKSYINNQVSSTKNPSNSYSGRRYYSTQINYNIDTLKFDQVRYKMNNIDDVDAQSPLHKMSNEDLDQYLLGAFTIIDGDTPKIDTSLILNNLKNNTEFRHPNIMEWISNWLINREYMDITVYNYILNYFLSVRKFNYASETFYNLTNRYPQLPNVDTYNVMIMVYMTLDRMDLAQETLYNINKIGLKLNGDTFLALIEMFGHDSKQLHTVINQMKDLGIKRTDSINGAIFHKILGKINDQAWADREYKQITKDGSKSECGPLTITAILIGLSKLKAFQKFDQYWHEMIHTRNIGLSEINISYIVYFYTVNRANEAWDFLMYRVFMLFPEYSSSTIITCSYMNAMILNHDFKTKIGVEQDKANSQLSFVNDILKRLGMENNINLLQYMLLSDKNTLKPETIDMIMDTIKESQGGEWSNIKGEVYHDLMLILIRTKQLFQVDKWNERMEENQCQLNNRLLGHLARHYLMLKKVKQMERFNAIAKERIESGARDSVNAMAYGSLIVYHEEEGREKESQWFVDRLYQSPSKNFILSSIDNICLIYLLKNNSREAFKWFNRRMDLGAPNPNSYLFFVVYYQLLDSPIANEWITKMVNAGMLSYLDSQSKERVENDFNIYSSIGK